MATRHIFMIPRFFGKPLSVKPRYGKPYRPVSKTDIAGVNHGARAIIHGKIVKNWSIRFHGVSNLLC